MMFLASLNLVLGRKADIDLGLDSECFDPKQMR
jgi:hypothetical protein